MPGNIGAGGVSLEFGLPIEQKTCNLVNRSGAALARGDLVALNVDFASTDGQAMVGLDPAVNVDGATGYVFGAAVAVTTANATRILLVALADIADNAVGRFGIEGLFDVEMNGANKGEFIVGTNGQTYGTPYTVAELQALTTAVGNVVGLALEDTSGAATGKCLFNGHAWRSFFGGDT